MTDAGGQAEPGCLGPAAMISSGAGFSVNFNRLVEGDLTLKNIRVQFLGSGDAFGSGGRLQPCIFVKSSSIGFLIDCGATALVAMRRYAVAPDEVDMILLSHLHGDHFGGVAFLIIDAQLISKRTKPLLIAGPAGTEQRVTALMELMFPGSAAVRRKFAVDFVELQPGKSQPLLGVAVTPYPVVHTATDDSFALRIECGGRIIAYTGDTEWTDVLLQACLGADLLIAEAYFYDKKIKFHLDYSSLMSHMADMMPRRLVITHMGEEMLRKVGNIEGDYAEDGRIFEL